MGFPVPNFNLTVNLWRRPNTVANPPDLVFLGNLSLGRRALVQNPPGTASNLGILNPSELLTPKLTDIRGTTAAQPSDCVEVPAGSGRFYVVGHVEDVGKGFSNEYRFALMWQMVSLMITLTGNPWACPPWPQPTP